MAADAGRPEREPVGTARSRRDPAAAAGNGAGTGRGRP
jgi:hypothetical protein